MLLDLPNLDGLIWTGDTEAFIVSESATWQDSWRDLFKKIGPRLFYLHVQKGQQQEESFFNELANLVLEECGTLRHLVCGGSEVQNNAIEENAIDEDALDEDAIDENAIEEDAIENDTIEEDALEVLVIGDVTLEPKLLEALQNKCIKVVLKIHN